MSYPASSSVRSLRASGKPISPTMHGAIDYVTSALVAAAPRIWDFPRPARMLCDSLAAGYTALSGVTDYPLSARRLVPFKAHGAAELAIGAALPAMPWLLGFSDHKPARTFFLALAGVTGIVAALTDWDAVQ
jgi:hypothetical protein